MGFPRLVSTKAIVEAVKAKYHIPKMYSLNTIRRGM